MYQIAKNQKTILFDKGKITFKSNIVEIVEVKNMFEQIIALRVYITSVKDDIVSQIDLPGNVVNEYTVCI
jgi:hypothetical protein